MGYADRWTTVRVELDEGIAWVELNRPEKRNAMSPTLNAEMVEVLEALDADDDCGVLVLTGAGDAFSAGMDLKEYFREVDGGARARAAQGAARRGAVAVAAAAHVREADDRDGQRLVLRRRVHAARRLRPRDRRGRGDVRPVRDQLGHPARQRRQQGARRHRRLARRAALRHDRAAPSTAGRPPRWASSTRASRSRELRGRGRVARARAAREEPGRAARGQARLQALRRDELGPGRGLPLREARAVAVPRRGARPRAGPRAVPRREADQAGPAGVRAADRA